MENDILYVTSKPIEDAMFSMTDAPQPRKLKAKEKQKIKQAALAEKLRTKCFVRTWRTNPCAHCSCEQKCEEDDKLLKEEKNNDDNGSD